MGRAVIEVTKDNFDEMILRSKQPVIADLWAEWCAPCRMLAPTMDEIANIFKGKINIVKINVDETPELATELSVMNIPTLIFFKDGKEAGRLIGLNTKEHIKKKIEEYFG